MVEQTTDAAMTIAIVGAGIAGLACAKRLSSARFDVTLFDKGKRPGGRLSTLQLDGMAWDFGAQYVPRGSGAFAAQLADWHAAGVVAPWPTGPAGAMVGVPTMAGLVAEMAAGQEVRFATQVTTLSRSRDGWFLGGNTFREGPFDAVILAIPAEQAAPLLSLHDLMAAREAAAIRSRACWTVMAAFGERVAAPDLISGAAPIFLAARDNSKPGRTDSECWVIQADPAWSATHLEWEAAPVAEALLAAFAQQCAAPLPETTFLKAHRWRFATPHGHAAQPLWNPQLRLGACGDWCASPDIAGAWNAGVALADRIVAAQADNRSPQAVLVK